MPRTSPPSPADPAQRLFLALWPDDGVRAQFESVRRQLPLYGGRLVAARNLHATLVFLGTTGSARRTCLERALASVGGDAFELALTKVEYRRRGGMVWLSAAENPSALGDLLAGLNAALAACGHVPEPRPYRAHVTLARDVRHAATAPAFAPILWRVHDFCLVSSTPTPSGSEYAVGRRWTLS